jgi:hypothetical protein
MWNVRKRPIVMFLYRKIPGVPIMYLTNHRYSIERMPDAYGAPKDR